MHNYFMEMEKNIFLKYVSVTVILEFCSCNNKGLNSRERFVGWGFLVGGFFGLFCLFCFPPCKFNAVALNSTTA